MTPAPAVVAAVVAAVVRSGQTGRLVRIVVAVASGVALFVGCGAFSVIGVIDSAVEQDVNANPSVCASGGGLALSDEQAATAMRAAGFTGEGLVAALAVAIAESGLNPTAVGDEHLANGTWGPSYGLFQIRSLHAQNGTGGVRDGSQLLDPSFNTQAAFSISAGGSNFGPWSVFRSGAYRAHLNRARAVVDAAAVPLTSGAVNCATALPAGVVGLDQTTLVQGHIRVHNSIARQVDAMMTAAAADGVTLRGGGWRSSDQQWQLRVAHCPDPMNSPASACTPATAKVGESNHERGLAIDFVLSGGVHAWLVRRAAEFGFQPLRGEPWHWSTDGR